MSQPSKIRVIRDAHLAWVPIPEMRISPIAQREGVSKGRIADMIANFDPEEIGALTVNHRDGYYYILDGWHRVEVLKGVGWGDQQVQCWTYEGMTESEEAERFLKLNNSIPVTAFDKFRVGIAAERADECDIDRIVRAADLRVSRDGGPSAVRAVVTLRKIYTNGGPGVLARTLRIAANSYGDAGLEKYVLDGLSLLCQRYEQLDDEYATGKLKAARGGVGVLLQKAEDARIKTGNLRSHCVAAAAVDIINTGKGRRIPSWWASQKAPAA